jgi:hypothetical protein
MFTVCAWCKKDLGEKPPLDDKSITHGMCKECFDKEMEKIKVEN